MMKKILLLVVFALLIGCSQLPTDLGERLPADVVTMNIDVVRSIQLKRYYEAVYVEFVATQSGTVYFYNDDAFNNPVKKADENFNFSTLLKVFSDDAYSKNVTYLTTPASGWYVGRIDGSLGYHGGGNAEPWYISFNVEVGKTYYIMLYNDKSTTKSPGGTTRALLSYEAPTEWVWY